MYRNIGFVYRLIDSFFRHRWLFVISLISITGITMTTLYLREKKFVASANVQIVPESKEIKDALGRVQPWTWITPAQNNVNSLNDLLGDNGAGGFVDNVLKDAKTNPPINIDPRARDPRLQTLRKNLSVYVMSDNQFGVSLVWDDPEECERIVKAIRTLYIDRIAEQKKAGAITVTTWLDKQIADTKQQIERAEAAQTDYMMGNQGKLPEQQTNMIDQLSNLQINLSQVQQDMAAAKQEASSLETKISHTPRTTVGETTRTFVTTENEALLMKARQDKFLLRAKGNAETGIAMTNANERIAELQKAVDMERKSNPNANVRVSESHEQDNPEYTSLNDNLTKARIVVQSKEREEQVVRNQISQAQAEISRYPAGSRSLRDKTRIVELLKANFASLMNKKMAVQMNSSVDSLNARAALEEIGTIYAEPTANAMKVAAMFAGSVVAGFICAFVLVVFSEWADPTIRYEGEVQSLMGIPVMASIADSPDLRALPTPASSSSGGHPAAGTA